MPLLLPNLVHKTRSLYYTPAKRAFLSQFLTTCQPRSVLPTLLVSKFIFTEAPVGDLQEDWWTALALLGLSFRSSIAWAKIHGLAVDSWVYLCWGVSYGLWQLSNKLLPPGCLLTNYDCIVLSSCLVYMYLASFYSRQFLHLGKDQKASSSMAFLGSNAACSHGIRASRFFP